MDINTLNSGYERRKNLTSVLFAGAAGFLAFGAVSTLALVAADALTQEYTAPLSITAFINRMSQLALSAFDNRTWHAGQMGAAVGALSAVAMGLSMWRHVPLTEPFTSDDPDDPRIFYDEDAEIHLKARFVTMAGKGGLDGLYIAPYLPLSRKLERRNLLVTGTPGSGKSNILRPVAQQAIARGDIVVLHCTKGDTTAAFRHADIILLSPTNRNGWAWDIGADIDGPAAAQEFAATVIEESKEIFFSNTARLVLADVITALGDEMGAKWGPRALLERVLSRPQELADMIGRLDLSASPLITSSDPDEVSRTVESVLATLISGALTTLRPMALAWSNLPQSRHFSIKAMLKRDWTGPKVLIVQSHPAFEILSRTVCGGALRFLCQQIAAPRATRTGFPNVTMVLDEFRSLGRIEGLDRCLSVAREQGLSMTIALQSLSQLRDLYGDAASTLESLFQIKIFAKQEMGEATNALSQMLGTRKITATLPNLLPKSDDKRLWISERQDRALFSPTQFSRDLAIFDPDTRKEVIEALLIFDGSAYQLGWPPTVWRRQSKGYVPARWTLKQLSNLAGAPSAKG